MDLIRLLHNSESASLKSQSISSDRAGLSSSISDPNELHRFSTGISNDEISTSRIHTQLRGRSATHPESLAFLDLGKGNVFIGVSFWYILSPGCSAPILLTLRLPLIRRVSKESPVVLNTPPRATHRYTLIIHIARGVHEGPSGSSGRIEFLAE